MGNKGKVFQTVEEASLAHNVLERVLVEYDSVITTSVQKDESLSGYYIEVVFDEFAEDLTEAKAEVLHTYPCTRDSAEEETLFTRMRACKRGLAQW